MNFIDFRVAIKEISMYHLIIIKTFFSSVPLESGLEGGTDA